MARLRSRQGAAKAPSSSPPKKNVAVDDSFSSDAVAPVSPDEQTQSKATFSKYSKTPPQPKGENKIRFSFTPVVASASPDKPEEVAKLRCVLFDANYADTSLLNESTATGSGEDDEEDGDGSDRGDGDDEEDDDAFERSSALHTAPAPSAGPAPAAATSTGGSEAMRVYLRMRPPLEGEQTSSDGTGVTIVNDSTIEARCPKGSQAARQAGVGSASTYSFSRVCDQDTTQQELFDTTVLPLLDDAVQYGHDGLVFTYGVTGAGKTHTMQGTPTDGGLLPRSLDLLFNGIAHLQPTSPRCRPLRHHEVAVLTSRQSSQLAAQRARVLAVVTDDLLHSHNNSLLSTTSLDAPTGETILIDDDPPLPTTTTTTSDTIVPPPPAATTTSTSEDSTAAMIRTLFEQERRDAATRVCDPRAVATGSLHNPPPQQDHTATTTTTTTTTSHEFSIWMSYCEIYNELIYDLLVAPPRNTHDRRTPLKLAEDREHNVYIKGLTEVCVDTADEAWALVRIGQLNRRVADTVLNKQSSRSHCVVSVRIVRTPAHSADLTDRQLVAQSRVSSLSFVDLAGSERQSKTNATGQRLKESSNINTSLLTLGKCMDALRRNQRKKMKLKHKSTGKSLAHSQSIVPYRESKLTRLFSNIFSGSGRALMVVNVSPSLSEFDETVHALKFSAVAKQVRTLTEVPSKVQHSRTVASAVAAVAVAPPPEVNAQLLATLELMQQKLLENEQRLASMEADIREEVAAEMAQQLAELENNFHSCMDDEQAATEATMDLRMDIVTKSAKKAIKQAHAQRWCSSSASELSALTPSTPVTSGITTSAPSTTPMSRRRVSSPGRRLALEAMRGALDAQQRAVLELTETANRYKAETSQLQEQVSALEVEMEQERAQIARERDEHEQGWGEERALLEASVQRAQAEVMRLSDYVERAQAAETACRAHEETIAALERRLFELEDKREQESQDKETVEVLKQELQAQQERAKVFEADYARLRDCVHKTAMAVASEREATSRRNEQMNVQLERERQALRDCMAKLEQLQREKSLATDKEERRRSAVKRNVSAMSEEGDALEMEMRSHDEGENQPGQDDAEEGRVKKRARTNVDDQQSSLPPAKTVVRARKGLTRSSSSTGSGGSRVRRVRGSASAAVTEVVEQTGVAARVESYKRAIADGPVKMKRKERDDDDNIEAEPNENGTDDSLERALGGATTKNVIDVTLQRTTKKKHQQEQEQSQSHTTEETKLPSSPVRSALASRLKNSPVVKKLRMRLGRRTATAESTADITDAAPPPAVGRVRELRSRKVPLRF